MLKTHKLFWIIAKGKKEVDLQPTAIKVAEQDVEGYINALRTKGYRKFEVASPEYAVMDKGTVEATKEIAVIDEGE